MWVCWEGSEECGSARRGVRSVGDLGGECRHSFAGASVC